jgi:hypothetical protein
MLFTNNKPFNAFWECNFRLFMILQWSFVELEAQNGTLETFSWLVLPLHA